MRRPSHLPLGLAAGAFAALVLATASPAHADDAAKKSPLIGAPSIRHRMEIRKGRFEITPQFMISMNQDFRHFIGGGLVLRYHINDWLSAGLSVAYGGGINTALADTVNNKLVAEGSGSTPATFQPTQEQFKAHLASVNLLASLYAQATPFAGKLAIFGSGFVRYDLYVMAGVGMMLLSNTWSAYTTTPTAKVTTSGCDQPSVNPDPNTCDPVNAGAKVAFMWGLGLHLFFNEWVGLNLEVRDFVGSTNFGGLDVNGDRALNGDDNALTNNFFAGAGVTFMLPVRAKISR